MSGAHATMNFAQARDNMVDGQVRPNRVTDPRIIQAMRRLPRERFVPPAMAALAYSDEDVPLGDGRYLVEPMVIARLVQALRPRAGERVLVTAAGTGYGAALVAACGAEVTALEEDPALLAIMRPALAELAPGVQVLDGPIGEGVAPQGAAWDAILLEGAVRAIPPALARLVGASGRLATVIAPPLGNGYAVLAEPSLRPGELRAQPLFDCATPPLPSLLPRPAFQF
jgi:protein-L-isoaspartate(D-aspartate) O-methyltransferase